MPGCCLCGARFLDQHMVMKQLHRLGGHQIGCHIGNGGLPDHLLESGNTLPVAIIIKKSASFARTQIFCRIRAGAVHIHRNAGDDVIDMIGKQPLDQNRAITGVIINFLLVDKGRHQAGPDRSRMRDGALHFATGQASQPSISSLLRSNEKCV